MIDTEYEIQSVPEAGIQEARGIKRLNKQAHAVQRNYALLVMAIPFLGSLEAARLAFTGRAGWLEAALFLGMYFVHMGGVTIGLHRQFSHRSFKSGPIFQALSIIAGSMGGQGPLLYWVSTHRAHHKYSDKAGDPHTPQLHGTGFRNRMRGLFYSHMPWMLSDTIASPSDFCKDILRDRALMKLNQGYFLWLILGLLIPGALAFAVTGDPARFWSGFIFGGMLRMFVANQAAWCVGSVCHMFGSRPFRTHDASGNNWWVAILTFGEGLQNNHHAFPRYYRHAVEWYEPDLSGWLVAILERLGVVWDVNRPSKATVEGLRLKA
jgi:stearoyl-CoA desaturase (delta-9 desaturase)